jgi:flagellar biogenesis protein FliO
MADYDLVVIGARRRVALVDAGRAGTLVGRLAQTIHAYPTWSLSTRIAAAQFFDRGPEPARRGQA